MKYTTKMGYGRKVEIIAENPEQIEDQLRNNGFNWYLKLMDFESPEPNTKLRIEVDYNRPRPVASITGLKKYKHTPEFQKDPSISLPGFYPIQIGEPEDTYSELERRFDYFREELLPSLQDLIIPLAGEYKVKMNEIRKINEKKQKADIRVFLKAENIGEKKVSQLFEDFLQIYDAENNYKPFGEILRQLISLTNLNLNQLRKPLREEIKNLGLDGLFFTPEYNKKEQQLNAIDQASMLSMFTEFMLHDKKSKSINQYLKVKIETGEEYILENVYMELFHQRMNFITDLSTQFTENPEQEHEELFTIYDVKIKKG